MCYIITHVLEFNNWRAFEQMVAFAEKYYGTSTPLVRMQVPMRIDANSWHGLRRIVDLLKPYVPKNPETMSIYGKIMFDVQKTYTTTPEERGARKIPIDESVENAVGILL